MELRHYWQILKRRWLLIVIPVVVVAVLTVVTYQKPATYYNVGMYYLVSQEPSPEAANTDEQRYYNWLTSEYIVNGLTDWVKGGEFATAVSLKLAENGLDIPAGAIQGSLAADNVRSKLEISLNNADPKALEAMIAAVTVVVQEQNAAALPQLGGETAVIVPLSQPVVNQISPGIRSQLDLPVRILVALIAGLGLALFVEYLDPTIRESRELEAIGLTVMVEIPKKVEELFVELSDYLRILKQRGWIIILVALLTAAAAFGFSKMQTEIFESNLKLLVLPSRTDFGQAQAAKELLRSYEQWLVSSYRAQDVIDVLGLDMTAGALLGDVKVASDNSSFVIQMTVENSNPDLANNIATAWGSLLIQWQNQNNDKLQKEDRITIEFLDDPQAGLASPNTKINTAAGLVFGALLGVLLVFGLEWYESGIIKRSEDVERYLDVPVIGSIPNQ